MPISFLDLVPKPPTDTVTIDTRDHGAQDIELVGVPLRALADIAKRYPAFAKVLDGGFGSILDNPDALAAIIAASLGHAGQREYEAHVASFPSADIIRIALAVIRLTFPQRQVDPLSPDVPSNGADADALALISPLQLSS
jgi:hypothetical protein